MNNKIIQRILIVFFCISIAVFVFYPLFSPGMPVTDDGDWMVIRLSAFYQSLADGQFPVRFLGRLNQSYGYPVANFLYPGFMYVGSILHFLGLPFTTAVKVLLGGSLCVSGISMYLWLKRFFSEHISVVGAVLFFISPYFLYDLYVRGSVGELLATAVFITTLYFIEAKKRLLIPFAIALLLISHNTLALLYMISIFFYVIVRKFWKAVIPIVLGFLMAGFFWIPALVERSYVVFSLTNVANPTHYFRASHVLVLAFLPVGIVGIYSFVRTWKKFGKEKLLFQTLFVFTLILSTVLGGVFWKIPALTSFVQFPYRFLSLFTVSLLWLFGYTVSTIKSDKMKYSIIITALLYTSIFAFQRVLTVRTVFQPEGYYFTNEATTTVSDEYMPRWVKTTPRVRVNEKMTWYQGNGTILDEVYSTRKITARIQAYEDSVLQINTVYYPGWGVSLDGRPIEIQHDNAMGLIRLFIPKGDYQLLVEFRETVFRFLTDVVSMSGIILYGVFVIMSKKYRK